eukprot:333349_1
MSIIKLRSSKRSIIKLSSTKRTPLKSNAILRSTKITNKTTKHDPILKLLEHRNAKYASYASEILSKGTYLNQCGHIVMSEYKKTNIWVYILQPLTGGYACTCSSVSPECKHLMVRQILGKPVISTVEPVHQVSMRENRVFYSVKAQSHSKPAIIVYRQEDLYKFSIVCKSHAYLCGHKRMFIDFFGLRKENIVPVRHVVSVPTIMNKQSVSYLPRIPPKCFSLEEDLEHNAEIEVSPIKLRHNAHVYPQYHDLFLQQHGHTVLHKQSRGVIFGAQQAFINITIHRYAHKTLSLSLPYEGRHDNLFNWNNKYLFCNNIFIEFNMQLRGGITMDAFVKIMSDRYINNSSQHTFPSVVCFSQCLFAYLKLINWSPLLTLNCVLGECGKRPQGETDKIITDGIRMDALFHHNRGIKRPSQLNANESPKQMQDKQRVLFTIREKAFRTNVTRFCINLCGRRTRDYASDREMCQPWKDQEKDIFLLNLQANYGALSRLLLDIERTHLYVSFYQH